MEIIKIVFIIKLKEKEKITNEIYVGNFSLKNLTELSKAFRFCDSLDEAFDTIVSICKSKKIILNKNNDEMIMIYKRIFLMEKLKKLN